ncbi:SoxY-related AACIE arm protein [Duganella sp. sic0402]|uniref:SoxY-related AACIE arm protein n=1 Tax=Duganella sp. sic0402 TaxID=2854786 RepID=UPI001C4432D5|nr:SoxY-related AACIE arm protein [Duganella sp. sic0402]MBV7539251.1 SoxY-related AACIE arm protein [Duganella sp. sic0402]
MKRRDALAAGAGLAMLALVRPASATPAEMTAAINTFSGGAKPQAGKVNFDIAQLIDNGNAVPVTVSVQGPAENVRAIAIFTERNPQTEVAVFTLSPHSAKAEVSTRIRLATSQRLMAVARMADGSYWSHQVEVIVALAACVEGEAP